MAWAVGLVPLAILAAGCLGTEDASQGTPVVDQGGGFGPGGPDRFPPPPPLVCPQGREDCSREFWNVTLDTGSSDALFQVALPLKVSEDGTTALMWFQNASVSAPRADIGLERTERGMTLFIQGTGRVVLHSAVLGLPPGGEPCCAEAYLDADWTTRTGGQGGEDPGTVWVRIDGSVARLEVTYAARSSFCQAKDIAFLEGPGTGWVELAFETTEAVCS